MTAFPRSDRYNPEWLRSCVSGGANSLWLTEWLTSAMDLQPGMRVLDLGCGRGASSVFLRREFGVQVWATDLWFGADDRHRRFRDAGVDDGVFPIRADARALPYAAEFFDAVVSIDSYVYYGTDDLYANYLARFVKPGGAIGIAGAGLTTEIAGPVPEQLRDWWEPSLACLHDAAWWLRHWERSGVLAVDVADTMVDGWRRWLDWQYEVNPDNAVEIAAVTADAGRHLGYVRAIAHRTDVAPDDPIESIPTTYQHHPLLRPVEK